jgi:hypothetical protein
MRAALGLTLCAALAACSDNTSTADDMTVPSDMTATVDMSASPDLVVRHACVGTTDQSTTCTQCEMNVFGQGAANSGPCKSQVQACLGDTNDAGTGMLNCPELVQCISSGMSPLTCGSEASSMARNLGLAAVQCANTACQSM